MQHTLDNVQRGNLPETNQFKWNGFYRARVVDAHDLRQLGRVKVHIPDLMPEKPPEGPDPTLEGLWAHPANNFLGGRNKQELAKIPDCDETMPYQGSCLIPPKGSWVWIFFECGDSNHPYYFAAGDFGQRKVLPENQNGEEWEKKWTLIKTQKGRCIIISDDEDDCRVEITGKKRQITNMPDGDPDSVFTIEGNQTTILLDEREGFEKLQIADYRGNYIVLHTDNNGIQDQLHIYMQDDIHIQTDKNLFITTGLNMFVTVGGMYNRSVLLSSNTVSGLGHSETALKFDRLALISDNTTALCFTNEMAGVYSNRMAAGMINDLAGGPINIHGLITNIEMGAMPSIFAFPALLALPAIPYGSRDQIQNIVSTAANSVVPVGDQEPIINKIITPTTGDDYSIQVGAVPIFKPVSSGPVEVNEVPVTPTPTPPPTSTPIIRKFGVGHMFAISLKDEYRTKIIPLIDKSYGEYTGFYLNRDLDPGADNYYLDSLAVPVWDNYRNPSSWTIDDTSKWWLNLDAFCLQAKQYKIAIVPTLLDFCDSPFNPFINYIALPSSSSSSSEPLPYTSDNWFDERQGEYIKKVIEHIKDSGVKYIINLGSKSYNQDQEDPSTLLPSAGYLRKLVYWLIDDCGVSVNKMSLTANSNRNLYDTSPYFSYKMYTGEYAPQDDELNNEEFVDGQWGGIGRTEVKDGDGNVIDGYVKYISDCSENGIACMNTWKMNWFESELPEGMTKDHPNAINYLFAPRQRESMRIIKDDSETNNGFIDFSI